MTLTNGIIPFVGVIFCAKTVIKKAKENMADLSMNKALVGEYIDIL